jgi:eukaryotic-like serine/threonine-protein kinase
LNSKKNKKLLSGFSIILLAILLIGILLTTGCVQGMSPVGWSGIATGDGIIYTGSKEGRVMSVNLNSNNAIVSAEPLKVQASGSACSSGSTSGACGGASPAIAIYGTPALSNVPVLGNLVYIAGYNGKIFAYDAASLQQRWVYPVDGNLAPIVSAISISGNTLFFGCTDKNVYALDTATGGKKWQFATEGEIWSTPICDNDTVFVSSFDKFVYALDATTGKEKWKFATQANNVSTPISLDGVLYIGSLDRNLYAINETNGDLVWKFEGGNWFWSRPVTLNGMIYAPCLDNKVYALDAKTGNKVAEYNLEGQIASWPVIVGNKVIAATNKGKLFSMDANNPSASPVLVSTIPENVTAPLGVMNDVVYINGPDNNIYAYNVSNGSKFSPISLKSQ